MTLRDVAYGHQQDVGRLADKAALRSVRLWNDIHPSDLDAGWDAIAPALGATIGSAQVSAAQKSVPYIESVAVGLGVTAAVGDVNAQAFAGWTREGRQVVPQL